MRKPHSTIVFVVFLCLGLFLAIPAEDVTETAYGESGDQSFQSALLGSDLVPSATASVRRHHGLPLGNPDRVTSGPRGEADGRRSAAPRLALALRCTLLC